MKICGCIVTMFLVALMFIPDRTWAMPPPPSGYFPRLISPSAGQVLHSGDNVRVEWAILAPKEPNWSMCEIELWLSLDGGRTYVMRITPSMDPHTTFFYWTVPNTPTSQAVLDIRFGCEPFYPETYNSQTASTFVIAGTGSGQ
jgi:hypothetical protein